MNYNEHEFLLTKMHSIRESILGNIFSITFAMLTNT